MLTRLFLPVFLFLGAMAPGAHAEGIEAFVTKDELQGLLQAFVDAAYGKSFRHLGEERDFDHGHLLFRSDSAKPVAVLYHTQELAHLEPRGSEYGYLDPEGRNWLQWIGTGVIENARRYERRGYPETADWRWFEYHDLPKLARRRTIIEKMLDPALDFSASRQWEFARLDCARAPAEAAGANVIRVKVPRRGPVCLALSLDAEWGQAARPALAAAR